MFNIFMSYYLTLRMLCVYSTDNSIRHMFSRVPQPARLARSERRHTTWFVHTEGEKPGRIS